MSDFTIDYSNEHQAMQGFGGSDRDNGTITSGQLDLFFSQTSGIGLSLLRASIDSDGTYVADPQNAVGALARGAKVWAAPWTPNPAWKSNGSRVGGTLLPAHYADWADTLCGFVTMMKTTHSVPIMAVSCQNEPDNSVPFDSCNYSSAQMIAFIDVFGPKLAALSPAPLLMSPEAENWNGLWGYGDAILADPTAQPFLAIIATHDYTYSTVTHADTTQPVWQTEVSTFDAQTASLANALTVASWVNRALTTGKCSAWHYWSLVGINTDNEGILAQDGSLTKRLFAIGNWSKYVRPGYKRIDVTGAVSGVSVTAFKDPSTGALTIVAINASGSNVTVSFGLTHASFVTVLSTHVTSGTAIGALGTDGNLSSGSVAGGVPATVTPASNQASVLLVPGVTTLTSQTTGSNAIFFGAGTTS